MSKKKKTRKKYTRIISPVPFTEIRPDVHTPSDGDDEGRFEVRFDPTMPLKKRWLVTDTWDEFASQLCERKAKAGRRIVIWRKQTKLTEQPGGTAKLKKFKTVPAPPPKAAPETTVTNKQRMSNAIATRAENMVRDGTGSAAGLAALAEALLKLEGSQDEG